MHPGDLVHFHHGEGTVALWHTTQPSYIIARLEPEDVGLIIAIERFRTMVFTHYGIGYVYPTFCIPVQ